MASFDPARRTSPAVRALFELRWRLGGLLGLDDDADTDRAPTLRDRLPPDLREAPRGPDSDGLPFRSLYLIENEWAAEVANRTVHAVMHVGWVSDPVAGHRGQVAVLVKPNGRLGSAYMTAIAPFRHLLVYPSMIRAIERQWQAR
jgi:hypothetical protein